MFTARSTFRPTVVSVLACALLAFATSSAAAQQDLRSPDARDAASSPSITATPAQGQDLRSPDARDAALPAPSSTVPEPQPIVQTPAAKVADDSNGVDWMALSLGIAGSLLAVGAVVAVTARSRRRQRPAVTA